MNAANQHVIEAVKALDVCPEHKFQVQERLGDGPTNETWSVTIDQERYVLRLVKPLAAVMGLSLKDELSIATAAGQHNLTAPIVASCTDRGIVLSRYLDGRTWTVDDLHDKAQLNRLARMLRRLHRLDCGARPLDLRITLHNYVQRSSDLRAEGWAKSALTQLDRITPRTPVLCHNDLTAANLIDDGQLFLIDWEYAALGDPLFDLAVVVAHHEVDATTSEHFLSTYLGRNDTEAAADLVRWCTVYKNLLALWLSALEAEPTVS